MQEEKGKAMKKSTDEVEEGLTKMGNQISM
jgi:hypothetical protein